VVVVAAAGAALLGSSWIAVAVCTEIPAAEVEVFRFVNGWPDWIEIPAWPIMQLGSLGAVAIAAAACVAARRWAPALAVAAAGITAWLLAKVVKELAGRDRPAEYLADVVLRPEWEGPGYLSGHAAVAFALATVLGGLVGRGWRFVLWAGAVATAVLRIYTGAHLPLDVIGGAGLGMVVGAGARWGLLRTREGEGSADPSPRRRSEGGNAPTAG
jgi:undecaprenyl-diphosphatase